MLGLPATDPRNWYRYALIHALDCPHGNWWFLPWHRGYLGWFERICRVYGIQAGELLLEHGQGLQPEIRQISEAPAIERGAGVSYRLVRREPPQVMHVEFAPRAAFEDLRAHHGEDFAIVLRGQVELLYGSERHLVRAGETVRFPGAEPHGLANAADAPATVVIVTTEPYW